MVDDVSVYVLQRAGRTRMKSNCCIYCKVPLDSDSVSKSDVIPDHLGNGLVLEEAVCKACNNDFNVQVEQPLKDHLSYLRAGLDLRGRRRKPVRVLADVEIQSLGKKMTVDLEHIEKKGIPPFKFRGDDGRQYYALIGNLDYIENKKAEISIKKPNIIWQEANDKGEVELQVNTLPVHTMNGQLARRLASKIAFERLCQKKANQVVLDKLYDEVRNYIMTGSSKKPVATLIYNEQIMNRNMNFPFPYHSIVLTNDMKRNRIVGVVSLFGLYYYLVRLSNYLSIRVHWDDCIVVDPQESNEYELLIKGSSSIGIPDEAWTMSEPKLRAAGEFALQKFKSALESRAFIVGSE